MVGLGTRLGVQAAMKNKKPTTAEQPADNTPTTAAPQLPAQLQRTPTEQLPKKGGEQIAALETQLDRCHTALLAAPAAPLFTPEQRMSLTSAAVAAARANPGWNQQAYQQEASFYLAEDARRQQAVVAAPIAAPIPAAAPTPVK